MSNILSESQTTGIIFYKYDIITKKIKIFLHNKNSILEDININAISKLDFNIDKLKNSYIVTNNKYNHRILLINTPENIEDITVYFEINNKLKNIWIDIDRFKLYFNNNQVNKRNKVNYLIKIFDTILEDMKQKLMLENIRKSFKFKNKNIFLIKNN